MCQAMECEPYPEVHENSSEKSYIIKSAYQKDNFDCKAEMGLGPELGE